MMIEAWSSELIFGCFQIQFTFSGVTKDPVHATIITSVSDGIIKFGAHTSPQFDCDLADKIGSETIFIIRICDDA